MNIYGLSSGMLLLRRMHKINGGFIPLQDDENRAEDYSNQTKNGHQERKAKY